jgi:thiosulfate reductase cytochrome b subunit
MSQGTNRSILRWVHLLCGLPLVGFVYGPPAETEQYRYMFQYVFMPVLLLSGLWMWKGHLVRRPFSKAD